MDELTFWKTLALWLADCEAATAYDVGSRKNSSKFARRRHAAICARTKKALEDRVFNGRPSTYESVVKRLGNSNITLEGA